MVDIKTYAKDMTPIKLLQMAINTFADAEMTHDVISRKVHMMGFQGAKRYNRYRRGKKKTDKRTFVFSCLCF